MLKNMPDLPEDSLADTLAHEYLHPNSIEHRLFTMFNRNGNAPLLCGWGSKEHGAISIYKCNHEELPPNSLLQTFDRIPLENLSPMTSNDLLV